MIVKAWEFILVGSIILLHDHSITDTHCSSSITSFIAEPTNNCDTDCKPFEEEEKAIKKKEKRKKRLLYHARRLLLLLSNF